MELIKTPYQKITVIQTPDYKHLVDQIDRLGVYPWKYNRIRLTLPKSTKFPYTRKTKMLYHFLREISEIVIADRLPFADLSETLADEITLLFQNVFDNYHNEIQDISLLDFVFQKEPTIVTILENYFLRKLAKEELFGDAENHIIKKNKKRRRHLHKRSFRTKRNKKRRFNKRRYLERAKRLFKRANVTLTKIRFGVLFLKTTRRNSFINISKRVKSKKKRTRFETRKKKSYLRVVYATSIGHLGTYKGRAKSSAVARKELAMLVAKTALKKHFRILDLIFISEMKRLYFTYLMGFAEKGLIVRLVKRIILRPHGYVRRPKARRT